MQGSADDSAAAGMQGLCSRAFAKVATALKCAGTQGWVCRCSAMEVYNDAAIDLIAGKCCASIRDEPAFMEVSSEEGADAAWRLEAKMNKMLRIAKRRLHFAATASNSRSSRSHLSLSLCLSVQAHQLDSSKAGSGGLWRTSRLSLVDLAGSERVAKSEVQGKAFREATHVNRSLLALGAVLSALARRCEHVPYRSSRLTLVLKDALKPTAAISIIGHINPIRGQLRESLSTLNFLSFARTIRTRPKVNAFAIKTMAPAASSRARAFSRTSTSVGGPAAKGSWAAAAEVLSASKGFKHCAKVLSDCGIGQVHLLPRHHPLFFHPLLLNARTHSVCLLTSRPAPSSPALTAHALHMQKELNQMAHELKQNKAKAHKLNKQSSATVCSPAGPRADHLIGGKVRQGRAFDSSRAISLLSLFF